MYQATDCFCHSTPSYSLKLCTCLSSPAQNTTSSLPLEENIPVVASGY